MAGFATSNPATTSKVPESARKKDPNAPVYKSPTTLIGETAGKAGSISDKFLGQQVQLYKPQNVSPDQVRAARVMTPLGSSEMKNSIMAAQGNVGQAGQLDPRVAAYLQAAQQGGQNTAQSLNYLQQAAAGQGPSAAQNQLRSGMDEAIRAQMTAAASRGFSPAAMRGAQMQ
jgi:hypothetical protein